MLARKQFSKPKIIILSGIVIAIWVIIGIVVYINFGAKPAGRARPVGISPPSAGTPPLSRDVVGTGRLRELNFSLFDGSVFTSLKIYGEVPLNTKTLGRSNPFAPPSASTAP